ncbi:LpxI family protein [Prosthecomicrobium sp. N25]|uniref:LpxI family protein n=1 Tax=Prosthecomicrobium sp. N25 TaxID=3129254 RepID=UPI0030777B01
MAATEPSSKAGPLVILAGGGDFPLIAAEQAMAQGREVMIAGVEGEASREIEDFPHAWLKRGQLGELFRLMRTFGAQDILLLGTFADRRMPTWREVDFTGVVEVVRHWSMLRDGDDSVLRKIARIIERRGFRIVSPADVAPGLLARSGLLGRYRPTDEDLADVLVGYRAAKALGRSDLGQAVVASGGAVIGREDARGTDALLEDVARARRGQGVRGAAGVLVKCMKPQQDARLDLPAIGPATIRNAAAAGLAGVAVEAGRTLIVDQDILAEVADRLGLFVLGFALPDEAERAPGG